MIRMNKEQLHFILQSCLLAYEGYTEQEMRSYGISKQLAEAGIKLYAYLKTINLKIENGSPTRI